MHTCSQQVAVRHDVAQKKKKLLVTETTALSAPATAEGARPAAPPGLRPAEAVPVNAVPVNAVPADTAAPECLPVTDDVILHPLPWSPGNQFGR